MQLNAFLQRTCRMCTKGYKQLLITNTGYQQSVGRKRCACTCTCSGYSDDAR